MSVNRWIAVLVVAVLGLVVLSSCGGGDRSTTTTGGGEGGEERPTSTAVPPAGISQADANCREMLRGVEGIAARARSGAYGSTLAMVTEGLAKPATQLMKRMARRQRSLQSTVDDPQFDLYVHFFDPIIVLAEQRVRAGQSLEVARSERLQGLLTNLGDEQRLAARRAGLRDCEVDFFGAMVRVANG